ncbi:MAG: LytTR family DNA-binding domain-containing protein [Pseudomonadota bacterium]
MDTAIIVDDEPHLAEYLQDKLSKLWPELEILGQANNGRSALALAAETQPDIAFLDIHMPGLSGLQVAESLPEHTRIVFVTAYDEFALEAFQRAAVDYLMKPVSDDRLEHTIERLRSKPTQIKSELVELLKDMGQTPQKHLQWIRTGLDDTTRLVATDEVVYFQADQKYTSVMTANAEHLVRRSIKELEAELDPNQFWRIHRGTIVRVDQIVSAVRDLRGRYTITLRDRSETLRASQTYGKLFKQM